MPLTLLPAPPDSKSYLHLSHHVKFCNQIFKDDDLSKNNLAVCAKLESMINTKPDYFNVPHAQMLEIISESAFGG
jgi:hypothetical protein